LNTVWPLTKMFGTFYWFYVFWSNTMQPNDLLSQPWPCHSAKSCLVSIFLVHIIVTCKRSSSSECLLPFDQNTWNIWLVLCLSVKSNSSNRLLVDSWKLPWACHLANRFFVDIMFRWNPFSQCFFQLQEVLNVIWPLCLVEISFVNRILYFYYCYYYLYYYASYTPLMVKIFFSVFCIWTKCKEPLLIVSFGHKPFCQQTWFIHGNC
jgi:hypothetical protein